jgi:hypothetical protein
MTAFIDIEKYEIDMGEVDDVRACLMKPWGYKELDRGLLYNMGLTCLHALHKVNWNAYNAQHYNGQVVTVDEVIFLPDLPPVPKPYRSWPEAFIMIFGGLQDCEYEPKEHKLKYVVEHVYSPDSVDPENNKIVFEIKGVIPTLEDARKYKTVAQQNGVHIVFILQEKGIICPWSRPRKDGSRMSQEEWIADKGFDFCYQGEEEAFRKTAKYRKLVETFGK